MTTMEAARAADVAGGLSRRAERARDARAYGWRRGADGARCTICVHGPDHRAGWTHRVTGDRGCESAAAAGDPSVGIGE